MAQHQNGGILDVIDAHSSIFTVGDVILNEEHLIEMCNVASWGNNVITHIAIGKSAIEDPVYGVLRLNNNSVFEFVEPNEKVLGLIGYLIAYPVTISVVTDQVLDDSSQFINWRYAAYLNVPRHHVFI